MTLLLIIAIVVFGIVVIAAKRLLGLPIKSGLRLAEHLALANERLERANEALRHIVSYDSTSTRETNIRLVTRLQLPSMRVI